MKLMLKKSIAVILAAVMTLSLSLIANAARTVLTGDMDEDGKITANDARSALRFSVDLDYYTRAQLKIGDTDNNGKLNAADARNILRYSVGLDSPKGETVEVNEEDYEEYINRPSADEIFNWILPDAPEVKAESGTFTFTVYGYGHGVGLSQYGALSLEDAGFTYDRILSHYYTGTEIKNIEEIPEKTVYPVYKEVSEGVFSYVPDELQTEELLARIIYQEIYGVTERGKYEEALKAMTLCVFSNLMYYDFNVESRWSVGIASPLSYEELPDNLKNLVKEVLGQYITVKGDNDAIQAVYSGLAAGMTASSESIWGGKSSYLTSVPSPFDMQREGFITQYTYTKEEIKKLITDYDKTIVLQEDPALWLKITEHTGSMDETRGYVTRIKVGNKELKGYNEFHMGLMGNTFRSSCFTITYTP